MITSWLDISLKGLVSNINRGVARLLSENFAQCKINAKKVGYPITNQNKFGKTLKLELTLKKKVNKKRRCFTDITATLDFNIITIVELS